MSLHTLADSQTDTNAPQNGPLDPVGAVYSMTNSPEGNAVVAYDRAADGTLSLRAEYPTGGRGSGAVTPPTDPLGSQGSLFLDRERRLLFVVNPGSDELSVFREEDTQLTLLDKAPSGGPFPVSVAVHGDLVYVLNSGGEANITGFKLSEDGRLNALPGSTRILNAGGTQPPNIFRSPGQVGFHPQGDRLVVSHKEGDRVLVFGLDEQGRPSQQPTTSLSAGRVPFGFTFDERDNLLLVEVFGNGNPEGGAASSYRLEENGSTEVISASVTTSQAATCWITYGNDFAYVTNNDGHSVSTFRVDEDGSLSLVGNGVAAAIGDNAFPVDLDLTADGRYLYALNAGYGTLSMFRTEEDGSLTSLGQVNGLPALDGAQGIAVR
jgi:6-phosphogluconolactonase (cycloisomerase 2 family)